MRKERHRSLYGLRNDSERHIFLGGVAHLVWEPFDLVMRQRDYFQPPLQSLFNFLHAEELAARARELGGYDLSDAGTVRFVN